MDQNLVLSVAGIESEDSDPLKDWEVHFAAEPWWLTLAKEEGEGVGAASGHALWHFSRPAPSVQVGGYATGLDSHQVTTHTWTTVNRKNVWQTWPAIRLPPTPEQQSTGTMCDKPGQPPGYHPQQQSTCRIICDWPGQPPGYCPHLNKSQHVEWYATDLDNSQQGQRATSLDSHTQVTTHTDKCQHQLNWCTRFVSE